MATKEVFGCKNFLDELSYFDWSEQLNWYLVAQLFEKAISTQKTLFQKAIFINLLGIAFCKNNMITQEFEKITSCNEPFVVIFDVVLYLNLFF